MRHRYILFHKPFDVVSQFSDRRETGRSTLRDYVPVPGIYPVGRLDRDSEGLMLLTDDGALQHRLTDPRYQHPRTYWAQVEGVPDEAALQHLRSGVLIQGWRTQPALASVLDPQPDVPPRDPPVRFRATIPTTWIELILTEGRNRQVRRMTAAVGFATLRLIRVGLGSVRLAGLAEGEWRDATRDELRKLTASKT